MGKSGSIIILLGKWIGNIIKISQMILLGLGVFNQVIK